MPQNIPVPADVVYDAYCKAGTVYNWPAPPDYFVVTAVIPRWGVVRSMQMSVSRDGKVVWDIRMQDFGVKLRDDTGTEEIWLSMQLYDPHGAPAVDHDYHVHAEIQFEGQSIDVNWSPIREAEARGEPIGP